MFPDGFCWLSGMRISDQKSLRKWEVSLAASLELLQRQATTF
jgi:hypothetical protein